MTTNIRTAKERTIVLLKRIAKEQGTGWFNMQLHREYHDNSLTLNDHANMLARGYLIRNKRTGSVRLSKSEDMREVLDLENKECYEQLQERKAYEHSKKCRELVPPPSSLTRHKPFIW